MIIPLGPFSRKFALFPLSTVQYSAPDTFCIPYRRASFFLFFVYYRNRSPEVDIPLLFLWFLLSPLNHRKVAYINNFKESTMGCGTCFYTVFLRLIQWNRSQPIWSALPLTKLIFEIYIFTFIIHQKMVFSLRVYWYSQQLYNSALLHKLDSSIYLNFRTRVFPKKAYFFQNWLLLSPF